MNKYILHAKFILYAKISKLKYYRTWNWDNPINKKAKKKTPAKKYKKNTLKKTKVNLD